jgi:WD40 repeat protein
VGTASGYLEDYDFKFTSQKKSKWKIPNISGTPNVLCTNKNERFIAIGDTKGSIITFNSIVNVYQKPLTRTNDSDAAARASKVSAMQYSLTSPTNLAAAYEDGSLILWETQKEKQVISYKEHEMPCTSLCINRHTNALIVSGGLDGLINFYDPNCKQYANTHTLTHT